MTCINSTLNRLCLFCSNHVHFLMVLRHSSRSAAWPSAVAQVAKQHQLHNGLSLWLNDADTHDQERPTLGPQPRVTVSGSSAAPSAFSSPPPAMSKAGECKAAAADGGGAVYRVAEPSLRRDVGAGVLRGGDVPERAVGEPTTSAGAADGPAQATPPPPPPALPMSHSHTPPSISNPGHFRPSPPQRGVVFHCALGPAPGCSIPAECTA
jgi:hypothetical protein